MKICNEALSSYLFHAILEWADSENDYNGIEDENFIKLVCKTTGMPKKEYNDIMMINKTIPFNDDSCKFKCSIAATSDSNCKDFCNMECPF